MLAVIFIVSCLAVSGFYACVLVHLRREEKREARTRLSTRRNSEAEARLRRETMVGVGLTVGGLAALFAGIEFFNSLVTWLHWY